MSIRVQCDGCGGEFNAPDAAAGKTATCPRCGGPIGIPAAPAGQVLVVCTGCGGRFAAPASAAGRVTTCPRCATKITVGAAGPAPPAGHAETDRPGVLPPPAPPAAPEPAEPAPGDAATPQPQADELPVLPSAGRFFYAHPENVQALEHMLALRQGAGSGFLHGLREHARYTGMIGGVSHGFAGKAIGAMAGLFIYSFTWPVYVFLFSRRTKELSRRVEQMRLTPSNLPVAVEVGTPRKPFGFFARIGWWFLPMARKRVGQLREEFERHTGGTFGGQWRPHNGIGEAARAFLRHFQEDCGAIVADPDMGVVQVVPKLADAVHVRHGQWMTMYHQYKDELVERKESFPLLNPGKQLNALQDAVNRHWEFHRRVARPGLVGTGGAASTA